MTGRARLRYLPFAAAARARTIELHGARHLRTRAGAVALRAGDTTARGRARPIACRARFVAGNVQLGLRPADGLPEIDIERVFKIGTLLRFLRLLLAAAAEELRKDIPKSARPASGGRLPRLPASRACLRGEEVGKIETAEVRTARGRFRAGARGTVLRIEADLIVHLPLLRIAQHVVRFLHVLEMVLGRFIARVQIGMIFTREFPV